MPIYDAFTAEKLLQLAKEVMLPAELKLPRVLHVSPHLPVVRKSPDGAVELIHHVLDMGNGEIVCSGEAFDAMFEGRPLVKTTTPGVPHAFGIEVRDYRRSSAEDHHTP